MGLGLPKNLTRRTGIRKHLQNKAGARILGTGVELSVGEGSGPAFAELDVRLRVEQARTPEALHSGSTLLNRSAAFKNDRPCSGAGKNQSSKKSRRTQPHHNRTRIHGTAFGNS